MTIGFGDFNYTEQDDQIILNKIVQFLGCDIDIGKEIYDVIKNENCAEHILLHRLEESTDEVVSQSFIVWVSDYLESYFLYKDQKTISDYEKLCLQGRKQYLVENTTATLFPNLTEATLEHRLEKMLLNENNIDLFTCTVCLNCTEDQKQCVNSHLLCTKCWDTIIKKGSKQCPYCKVSVTKKAINRNLFYSKVLAREEVRCPYYLDYLENKATEDRDTDNSDVCCNTMTHGDLIDKHKNKCAFRKLECLCGKEMIQSLIKKHHVEECKKTQFKCKFCNDYFYRENQDHHFTHCKCMPINCPQCSLGIKRQNLSTHIEDICPNTTIPCPFKDVGCKSRFERNKLQSHLALYNSHLEYISLLSDSVHSAKKENQKLQIKLQDLQHKVHVDYWKLPKNRYK